MPTVVSADADEANKRSATAVRSETRCVMSVLSG
jgi:hypothetical protein